MKAVPSPVLERLDLLTEEDRDTSRLASTGTDYVRARVKDVYHKTVTDKREGMTFEYKGLKVPNYFD